MGAKVNTKRPLSPVAQILTGTNKPITSAKEITEGMKTDPVKTKGKLVDPLGVSHSTEFIHNTAGDALDPERIPPPTTPATSELAPPEREPVADEVLNERRLNRIRTRSARQTRFAPQTQILSTPNLASRTLLGA